MSTTPCSNCHNPVPAGAAFCPTCAFPQPTAAGQQPGGTPAQAPPPAQVPPPAQAPPPAQTPPETAATQPIAPTPVPPATPATPAAAVPPGQPPGSITPTQPVAQPAYAPAAGGPVAPKSGIGGKVVAGILAVVVIIGIFAVIKVAGGPDETAPVSAEGEEVEEPTEAEVEEVAEEDTTEEAAPEEEVVEEQAPPPPEEPVREEPSAEEELAGLVQQRVGPYRLAQVESGQEFAVNSGGVGAIFAGYTTPGGGALFHILAAYPSPNKANQILKAAAKGAVRGGARLVEVGPVNIDGRRTGTWVLLQGKTQSILWTNGVLFAVADGAHPHPIKFFSNVSY